MYVKCIECQLEMEETGLDDGLVVFQCPDCKKEVAIEEEG